MNTNNTKTQQNKIFNKNVNILNKVPTLFVQDY